MIGAASPNAIVAQILSPISVVLFFLFGGFFVNNHSIPVWYKWIREISIFRYGYEALMKNEFEGLKFTCTDAQKIHGQCPVPDGETQLKLMGMLDVEIWKDVVILLAMVVGYRLLAYICLRFLYKEKR